MSTMRAISTELLKERRGSLKFLLNDSVIVFFPATQQHRDMKLEGLSYEDDYRGNALAGVVAPERVEIWFHKAFSDISTGFAAAGIGIFTTDIVSPPGFSRFARTGRSFPTRCTGHFEAGSRTPVVPRRSVQAFGNKMKRLLMFFAGLSNQRPQANPR
jgi:hypothetical protein